MRRLFLALIVALACGCRLGAAGVGLGPLSRRCRLARSGRRLYAWHGGGGWAVRAGAMAGTAAGDPGALLRPEPRWVAAVGAAVGATYAALPAGCPYANAYYYCGGVYYQPYYGPNGVVYRVVPAP